MLHLVFGRGRERLHWDIHVFDSEFIRLFLFGLGRSTSFPEVEVHLDAHSAEFSQANGSRITAPIDLIVYLVEITDMSSRLFGPSHQLQYAEKEGEGTKRTFELHLSYCHYCLGVFGGFPGCDSAPPT